MPELGLRHDYRVLDVPLDASPRAIKSNYRKLIKRWHPDRYRPQSDAYGDSSLMTKLINESYARIKNAPLRNGAVNAPLSEASLSPDLWDEPDGHDSLQSEYQACDPNQGAVDYYKLLERARQTAARDDALRPFDWFGFFVRFVCGAFFGAVFSFSVIIRLYQERPATIYAAVVATVIACGLASGLGGDKFWRSIRPSGVWWWWRW
jgi:DnaJ domain